MEFAGRPFRMFDLAGADYVARLMQQGLYEPPLPMLTMAVIARTQGLFLDVGANNGLYSILAAITRTDLRVLAFEPHPEVLKALRRNLALNELSERVTVHEIALSDSVGTAELHVPDDAHGLLETSASLEAGFKPFVRTITVDKRRLDDLDLGGEVSLIKADIEGHEAAFLNGALGVLQRDRPMVFAEMLAPAVATFRSLSQMMMELGYLPFRLRQEQAILTRAIAYDPLAWNYVLVPREKMPLFEDCCTTHQIEIVRPQ